MRKHFKNLRKAFQHSEVVANPRLPRPELKDAVHARHRCQLRVCDLESHTAQGGSENSPSRRLSVQHPSLFALRLDGIAFATAQCADLALRGAIGSRNTERL